METDTSRDGLLSSVNSLLGGESVFANEVTGPGTAWYQTRDTDALVSVLAPRLPNERDS